MNQSPGHRIPLETAGVEVELFLPRSSIAASISSQPLTEFQNVPSANHDA